MKKKIIITIILLAAFTLLVGQTLQYRIPGTQYKRFKAEQTVLLTGDSLWLYNTKSTFPRVYLESVQGGATGPGIEHYLNSSTPADDDVLSQYRGYGNDAGLNKTLYGSISITSEDVSNTDESGGLYNYLLMDNSFVDMFHISGYIGTVGQGEIHFNDQSKDMDYYFESDNDANALVIEGSTGNIGLGTATPAAHLDLGSMGTSPTRHALLITQPSSQWVYDALRIELTGQSYGIRINQSGAVTNKALYINNTSNGEAINISNTGTGIALAIATSSQEYGISLSNTGTGTGIRAYNSGTGSGIYTLTNSATKRALFVGAGLSYFRGKIGIYKSAPDSAFTDSLGAHIYGGLLVGKNITGNSYGSDKSVSDTELKYINTLSSNAQNQFNNLLDSISVHHDSLVVHRTDIDANVLSINNNADSLVVHRSDINDNVDSLVVHRTDINNIMASTGDAISIRGKDITQKSPSDNYILKYNISLDSLIWEIDASGAGGSDFADSLTHEGRHVTGDSVMLDAEGYARFQPLEATLTDIADGTIAENLVNIAYPWADNEVADDITASNYLPLASFNDSINVIVWSGDLGGTGKSPTVTDDSHNHIITNIDNLQDSLDIKLYRSLFGDSLTSKIGVTVQAWDADLDDLADGTLTATKVQYGEYFITTAGTNGYVWASDGSGVGGWIANVGGDSTWTTITIDDTIYGNPKAYISLDHLDASDGNPDSAIYVDASGNVGIGIVAPTEKFEIYGSGELNQLIKSSNNLAQLKIDAGSGYDSKLIFLESGNVRWNLLNDTDDSDKFKIQDAGSNDMFSIEDKGTTGDLYVTGNIRGTTYGSDRSISDAEFLYINTLSSNAQTQITAKLAKVDFDDSLTANVGSIVQGYDADLSDLADGSLTASKVAGVADADYGDVTVSGGSWAVEDDSHAHIISNVDYLQDSLNIKLNISYFDDSLSANVGSIVQAWDADLDDLADGELTATKVQYGSLFITTAGTSGQIWTSDGSGAGAWVANAIGTDSTWDIITVGQINSSADLNIVPTGDDVLLDAGLTVGSTTQAGDNNLRVEGTSTLVGNVTLTANLLPSAVGTPTIGSTSAEWGHTYIADDKKVYFGNDQDFSIEYDEDGLDIAQFNGKNIGFNGYYALNLQNISDLVAGAGKTGYWFNGSSSIITVADNNNLDMGTNDFTWFFSFNFKGTAIQSLIGKRMNPGDGNTGILIYPYHPTDANKVRFRLDDGGVAAILNSDAVLTSDINNTLTCMRTSDVLKMYVNGNLQSGTTSASGFDISNADNLDIGNYGGGEYFNGHVYTVYLFNLALTAAEVRALSSGAPIPYAYNGDGGSVPSQTEKMPNQVDRDFSGASAWANVDLNAYDETTDLTITATAANQYCTLVAASAPTAIGKRHRMTYDLANIVSTWTLKSFDGTQTIGTISANATQGSLEWTATTTGGYRLVANSTTSSGDFDNFTLKQIGAVAIYRQDGITAPTWHDASGNELDGTVSGAIVTNPKPVVYVASANSTTPIIINNTATDGDPTLAFQLSGTSTFTMGVDDGDNDLFKIGTTAIGTNTRLAIDATGNVFIGDNANTKSTQALIINQNASDDEIFAGKSSDVAHGFTTDTEADTYFRLLKQSATLGGLGIYGYTDATSSVGGLYLSGSQGAADPTDTDPAVIIAGSKLSGTARAALGNAETVLQLRNHTTNLMTALGNGNVGMGLIDPDASLHVFSATAPQFIITHTNKADSATFGVDADGYLTITPSGKRIGISTSSPEARVEIEGSNGYDLGGLLIDHNEAGNAYALEVDAESLTYPAFYSHGYKAGYFVQDLTNGYAGYFTRSLQEVGSNPLVTIFDNNTANTQTALYVQQGGTSAKILSLVGGTTEYFTVFRSGEVGINEPDIGDLAGYKLTVSGNQHITGNLLVDGSITGTLASYFLNASDGDPTNVVYVEATGLVGVGTTDADAKLHVVSSTTPQFIITHTNKDDSVKFSLDINGMLTINPTGEVVYVDGRFDTDTLVVLGNKWSTSTGYLNGAWIGSTSIGAGALAANSVIEANLKFVDSPADEDIMTYESTTGDFEWHTPAQIITAGTNLSWSGTTLNASLTGVGHFLNASDNDPDSVVYVNAAGLTGIRTTNPKQYLHVLGAQGTVNNTPPTYAWLVVENNGANSIQLYSGDESTSSIDFGNPTSDSEGCISYQEANHMMELRANNLDDQLILAYTGHVGIRTGDPSYNFTSYDPQNVPNFIQLINVTTGSSATDGTLIGIAADGTFQINNLEVKPYEFYTHNDSLRFYIHCNGLGYGFDTNTFNASARNVLAIANGQAPAAGTANQSYIYTVAGEGYWMDASGNATIQTPHDPITGEWIFYSENVNTGRKYRVNMEKLVSAVEEITGEKFSEEWFEEIE